MKIFPPMAVCPTESNGKKLCIRMQECHSRKYPIVWSSGNYAVLLDVNLFYIVRLRNVNYKFMVLYTGSSRRMFLYGFCKNGSDVWGIIVLWLNESCCLNGNAFMAGWESLEAYFQISFGVCAEAHKGYNYECVIIAMRIKVVCIYPFTGRIPFSMIPKPRGWGPVWTPMVAPIW